MDKSSGLSPFRTRFTIEPTGETVRNVRGRVFIKRPERWAV